MLLTIDVGNTNITLGVFKEDTLLFVSRIATNRAKMPDQYAIEFKQILTLYGVCSEGFVGCAISCVVPELSQTICDAAYTVTQSRIVLLGPGVKTGINILVDNPAQVGADLVAGAVGAIDLYPLPCLVADLGTATKISVINSDGAFCGCTIAPGVGISLEALSARTSQLPSISMKTPAKAIGKNTIDSMQSGIVFGNAAMLDGLCEKLEAELGEKVKTTVATGGLAQDLVKSCRRDIIYKGDLILHGLKIIFMKNS